MEHLRLVLGFLPDVLVELVDFETCLPQKLFVAASPNVQENFKLQLFDERKLKLVDGIWNIKACTGNKYLKEINPMNMKGLTLLVFALSRSISFA